MKINIKYKKKSFSFIVKINGSLFFRFSMKNNINSSINISLVTYNYVLLNRILRQFGLVKPLLNKNDYY